MSNCLNPRKEQGENVEEPDKVPFGLVELDRASLGHAGPRVYATRSDAKTDQGTTVCINDVQNPVIPRSAAITLAVGYPDMVKVNGKPMFDGGFASSNLPLSPAAQKMARGQARCWQC